MSILVGKRICFEEEMSGSRVKNLNKKQDSSLADYKRSIRKGDKIENLHDMRKKSAKFNNLKYVFQIMGFFCILVVQYLT